MAAHGIELEVEAAQSIHGKPTGTRPSTCHALVPIVDVEGGFTALFRIMHCDLTTEQGGGGEAQRELLMYFTIGKIDDAIGGWYGRASGR